MRTFHALLISVLSISCIHALRADQVALKNGDRVTGTVLKKEADTLTLRSDIMGVVSIPWSQVASIRTNGPVTAVVGGHSVQAPIDSASTQTPLDSIVTIRDAEEEAAYERLLHPTWLQLWQGTATVGLAGAAGNARTSTFTGDVVTSRTTSHDKTSLYFNTVKSSARINGVNADTADAVRGGWKYARNIFSRFDLNTFNDYEHDRFQDLDLRFVGGAGLGLHVWKGERGVLTAEGGASYDRDRFAANASTVAFTRHSFDGYWGDEFNYRVTAASRIVQTFRAFNDPSGGGSMRINFDLTATTKFRKWLVWNVSLSDRYLSDPPVGSKTNDVLYSTGLGVTFGH